MKPDAGVIADRRGRVAGARIHDDELEIGVILILKVTNRLLSPIGSAVRWHDARDKRLLRGGVRGRRLAERRPRYYRCHRLRDGGRGEMLADLAAAMLSVTSACAAEL